LSTWSSEIYIEMKAEWKYETLYIQIRPLGPGPTEPNQ